MSCPKGGDAGARRLSEGSVARATVRGEGQRLGLSGTAQGSVARAQDYSSNTKALGSFISS